MAITTCCLIRENIYHDYSCYSKYCSHSLLLSLIHWYTAYFNIPPLTNSLIQYTNKPDLTLLFSLSNRIITVSLLIKHNASICYCTPYCPLFIVILHSATLCQSYNVTIHLEVPMDCDPGIKKLEQTDRWVNSSYSPFLCLSHTVLFSLPSLSLFLSLSHSLTHCSLFSPFPLSLILSHTVLFSLPSLSLSLSLSLSYNSWTIKILLSYHGNI